MISSMHGSGAQQLAANAQVARTLQTEVVPTDKGKAIRKSPTEAQDLASRQASVLNTHNVRVCVTPFKL